MNTEVLADALVAADATLISELSALRRARGLTEEEVAGRIGVASGVVRAFEHERLDARLSFIRRYAHAVGATVAHGVTTAD
jgi:transcriptional regulator with XRE-family HTH domain